LFVFKGLNEKNDIIFELHDKFSWNLKRGLLYVSICILKHTCFMIQNSTDVTWECE